MSTHTFTLNKEDKELTVTAGWDPVLKNFYLVVERDLTEEELDALNTEPEDSDEESDLVEDELLEDGLLYSNLNDGAITRNPELGQTFDYFENKLKELGISIPETMLAAVKDNSLDGGDPDVDVDHTVE